MDCIAIVVSIVLLLAIHSEIRRPCPQSRTHHTRALRIALGESPMNSAVLIVGQSTIAKAVPLESDGTTENINAVVTSASWSVSDPAILEQTVNSDLTATYKALAAGTASVSLSAVVTDADGTITTLSASATVSVSAPPARTASIGIEFSTPA